VLAIFISFIGPYNTRFLHKILIKVGPNLHADEEPDYLEQQHWIHVHSGSNLQPRHTEKERHEIVGLYLEALQLVMKNGEQISLRGK
jgi:hypothetical protein